MPRSRPPHPLLIRSAWSAVALLVLIGVVAGVGRAVFVADAAGRGEVLRERLFAVLGQAEPDRVRRAAEVARFDGRFAAHPILTLVHVVPGALFLAMAPFQFSARVRRRSISMHRWMGRTLVASGLLFGSSALYFGLRNPFGGAAEAAAIAFFGGLFLLALGQAVAAIRRRHVEGHREWMIRAFAMAIGIATIRAIGLAIDLVLAPSGLRAPELLVTSIWIGWTTMAVAAEAWIRYTRDARPVRQGAST